jgi:hypothetical protein
VSQLRRRRSRFRRQQRRLSLGQHLRSGSSRRIARTQFFPSLGNIRCRCLRPFRHTWRQLFPPRPLQQPLRRTRGQPMTGLVDADRHHLELPPVNRLQNRSRREQRNLMLPAPPAKQNSHPQFFCHCFFDHRTGRKNSALNQCRTPHNIFFPNAEQASSTARSAVRLCSSITGFTSTISKLSRRPWSAMISIARCASR